MTTKCERCGESLDSVEISAGPTLFEGKTMIICPRCWWGNPVDETEDGGEA